MYQTLYRKYRPKTFDEVVGQSIIIKTLKNEIENNKLNHAYLFSGPRGTGKTSVAKILANVINCENPTKAIACGECVNCTQKNNIDIIEIDAASNNGVDEIRELKSKVNLVPSSGKYKVYIIDEVHMLTIGAFNALLKTLEEPPMHIIFVLATTEPHKIPITILSRCQRFNFKKIGINEIRNKLFDVSKEEKIEITDDSLYEIARLSDGGMRDALSLLDQAISYCDDKITLEIIHEINGTLPVEELIKLLKYISNNELLKILNAIDKFNDNGKNLIKLTEEFVFFLRNVLLYLASPEYFTHENDNGEEYKNISQKMTKERLLEIIQELNKTLYEMKHGNNPKLLIELSLINIVNIKENNKKEIKEVPEIKSEIENGEKEPEINNSKKPDDKSNKNKSLFTESNWILFKNRRIENSLAGFSKKEHLQKRKKMENLVSLLINPEYSKHISLVFDGDLKSSGNNYLIYLFEDDSQVEIFNSNLKKLEKIVNEYFKEKYHLIAVTGDEWNSIKKEFNSKTKKYEFKDEEISFESIFASSKKNNKNNKKDEVESLFEKLIEYEEEIK